MSTITHQTAEQALADKTPGAKILPTKEECLKMTGQPAISAGGVAGVYSTPMQCAGGWVVGVSYGPSAKSGE